MEITSDVSKATTVDLLAVLIGRDLAKNLARKPLTEVMGFSSPRQMSLGEELIPYGTHPALAAAKELVTRCFEEDMSKTTFQVFSSPPAAKSFLVSRLGNLEYEAFWALWIDSQHRLIAAEAIFRGTLTETSVYPRELLKLALRYNAASVVLAHNHPSGVAECSRADERLTNHLKSALAMIDVKVLDHLIVAGTSCMSFAERGLL